MKEVTERDLRAPEFQHGEPSDYEFREDGKIVRKDRWEQGIRRIAGIVGIGARQEWEIDEVIAEVVSMRDRLQIFLAEQIK